jgi:uncharacterized protein (TIGR03067 family)
MKRLGVVALLLLTSTSFSQDAASELKKLEGTWIPSAAELAGLPFDEATRKTMKLVVEGEKYTVTVAKQVDRGSFKLDPSKKPKAMDIIGGDGPNQGKTFLAIYDLDGDTLRVCYDLTGKARPSEFKTAKGGPLLFFVTYQRMK